MQRSSLVTLVTLVTMVTLITLASLVALVVMPPGESAAKDGLSRADTARTDTARTDTTAPDAASAQTGATVDEEGEDAGAATQADPFETSGANVMLEILADFERFWVGVTPPDERRLEGLATALGLVTESESDDPVAVVVGRGAEVVLRIADAMFARATRETTNAAELTENTNAIPAGVPPWEMPGFEESCAQQLEILSRVKARVDAGMEFDGLSNEHLRKVVETTGQMLSMGQLLSKIQSLGGAAEGDRPAMLGNLVPTLEDLMAGSSPTGGRPVTPSPEMLRELVARASSAETAGGAAKAPDTKPTATDIRLARALRDVRRSVKELQERLSRLEEALDISRETTKTTGGNR